MSQQHHLTPGLRDSFIRTLEEFGLTERIARHVVNDRTGKSAKVMIHSLGFIPDNQRADLAEAKEIFGPKNFFGPNEWHKKYGPIFSLPAAPKIPWKKETLQQCAKTHFLFLRVAKLADDPVTIQTLKALHSGARHPKISGVAGENWYFEEAFANQQIKFGWCLMPLKPQASGVPDGYLIQDSVTRAMANMLVYLNTDEYLDQGEWILTSDSTDNGRAVYLTASPVLGIRFYPPDMPTSQFGYALERKPDGL